MYVFGGNTKSRIYPNITSKDSKWRPVLLKRDGFSILNLIEGKNEKEISYSNQLRFR